LAEDGGPVAQDSTPRLGVGRLDLQARYRRLQSGQNQKLVGGNMTIRAKLSSAA